MSDNDAAETTADESGRGTVIAVVSPKGGVGRTVVAVNSALALNSRGGKGNTVVVDTDLQFGDVALGLQVESEYSIVDVVSEAGQDYGSVFDMLAQHQSEMFVLPAPPDPISADLVSPDALVDLILMLRNAFRFVVIDTASFFGDPGLSLIEIADRVLFVIDPDLQTIKNSKLMLDTLRYIGVDTGKFALVLNRSDLKSRLELDRVERTLDLEIAARIPVEERMTECVNEGIPVVGLLPKSNATDAFRHIADTMLGKTAAQPPADARRRKRR